MIKCVPHVQHDCFSSFNQSDHCFLVSSLPLPSSLRKLPIQVMTDHCDPGSIQGTDAIRRFFGGKGLCNVHQKGGGGDLKRQV